MPSYTTEQIRQRVDGTLRGPADLKINGVEHLDRATAGQVSFIGDENYAKRWATSSASAALVEQGIAVEAGAGRALIMVANVDLAMAKALEMFAPPLPAAEPGVHASAVVDSTAELGPGVCVGPLCVVGARAVIGEGTILEAQVTVLQDSRIGRDCRIWPGTVVRERCQIGDRCVLHPNVTIGADGFGYRPGGAGGPPLVKIPQIGTVVIGDDVEIGAGTCVDRGKFSATTIGQGTKIDNLCQIAHNCEVGRWCVLAGQVGLAGSVTLGDGVMLGGKVAVRDHVTIGAGARLAACAAVMDDVPAKAVWGGYPAQDARTALREHASVRKLPQLLKQLRRQLGIADRNGKA